jgi:prolyl-tRNA synthetase
MMGGKMAHEFMYLSPIGEDSLVLCDQCGYTANRQVARFRKPAAPAEDSLPLQKVATPGVTTIAALAEFLGGGFPESKTAKAVFQVATITRGEEDVQVFVFAVVRGDMEVNETKLANAVKAKALRPAHEEEIRAIGAAPGYGSPIGIQPGVLVLVDDLIPTSPNLVAGANEDGYHLLHTNYGRDYTAVIVADIVAVQDGDACAICGGPLHTSRGVEVGNIFKLGTRYSDSLGCTFLDRDGKEKPVIMGSYGIGSGRLLACVAEQYNDEHGLKWPISVAPFQVHIVMLKGGEETAARLHDELTEAGVEVLLDDREDLSAGVKFNDADLIGIPLRLTVGARALKEGGVELKHRGGGAATLVLLGEVTAVVLAEIAALHAEIASRAVIVPYTD